MQPNTPTTCRYMIVTIFQYNNGANALDPDAREIPTRSDATTTCAVAQYQLMHVHYMCTYM